MRFPLLIILLSTSFCVFGQNKNYTTLGGEVQIYAAGIIYGIRGDFDLGMHHSFNGRIGYNSADRQDFSPHNDHEAGGGFGATFGYRYFIKPRQKGIFLGAKVEFWQLTIDWQDKTSTPTEGTTAITVFQPTFEIGYLFLLNDAFAISPTLAVGREINIVTRGEAVAEGGITLLGVNLGYRF